MRNQNYKRWIEDNLLIVDKTGRLVPFRLNPIQAKYLEEKATNRDIILKARQQGFSSVILAMFTMDFILVPNTYNVVIADNEDNAEGLLDRVKKYLEYWGETNKVNIKPMLKYNSKYHLYNEITNSTYKIGTAKNVNFGRSKTISNLHMSECAFYPYLEDILAGAIQATIPTGRVILETTANGYNEFKTLWDNCVSGIQGYTPHFFRASEFYSEDFLATKRRELGRSYPQEYPNSPEEAFLTTGDLYFDAESLKLYLDKVQEPALFNIRI